MPKITSTSGLNEAIKLLEDKQALQGKLLKEQIVFFTESLNPVNLIKNAFNRAITSPGLTSKTLSAVFGILTGFFTTKLVKHASGNLLKKVLTSIAQIGVTYILANYPDPILSFGQKIIQPFFAKKQDIQGNK